MTNTNTNPVSETEETTVAISLKGKYARHTIMNTARALIGVTSTLVQASGLATTKLTEVTLDALPGQTGQMIADNANKGGFKGWKSSFISDDATTELVDRVMYAKDVVLGNDAYAKWVRDLSKADSADVTLAIEAGVTVEELEKSLELDPLGDLATKIINDKLDSMED